MWSKTTASGKPGARLSARLKSSLRKFVSKKLFQRNHQKLILVDDHIFIGSSNIGADYGGDKYGNDMFLDLNMRVKGYCIEKMYHLIENVLLKKIKKREIVTTEGFKKRKIQKAFKGLEKYHTGDYVCDDKYDILVSKCGKKAEIQNDLFNNILHAKRKIVLLSPYYFDSVLEYLPLIEAARRGVEVEILTSKKRDIDCYKSLKNEYLFKELIEAGIKVYEFPDKYLHGKAFLFDDKVLHIGSFNLDGWSFKNNTGE